MRGGQEGVHISDDGGFADHDCAARGRYVTSDRSGRPCGVKATQVNSSTPPVGWRSPALPVPTLNTVGEAIALANDSVCGLAASAYTDDLRNAVKAARAIRAGAVTLDRRAGPQ